jgi:hypothetical protein
MAFDPTYKMSIQDANGKYYSANQSAADGSWSVTTSPTLAYLNVLPDGWADLTIQWERDTNYLGIYRSRSDQGFKFSQDARAIIKYIRSTQGIVGYGILNIYILNYSDTVITYPVYYSSELDFKTFSDDATARQVSISTLDGQLYRDLQSRGDTEFNAPMWLNIGTDASPEWVRNGDNAFVCHNGIKLLYNATFAGGATATTPTTFELFGFFGSNCTSLGQTTFPGLYPYNIVQNNGATTYIGNDILQLQIPQRNQSTWLNQNNNSFSGLNSPNFYSRNNFCLKNAIVTGQSFQLNVQVKASFISNGTSDPSHGTIIVNGAPTLNTFLGFVLFGIDPSQTPGTFDGLPDKYHSSVYGNDIWAIAPLPGVPTTQPASTYTSQLLGYIPLVDGTNVVDINYVSNPMLITLLPNYVYVVGMVFDNYITNPFQEVFGAGGLGGTANANFSLTDFQVSFFSEYNQWPSNAAPVPAPSLNPSVFPSMRLWYLMQLLTSYLPTINADGYGFPKPVATDYTFKSDFLSAGLFGTPPVTVKDVVPSQIHITSAYCIHDLQGNPYITASVKQGFNFCKKVLGCGMGIEYDTNGNPTILRIEDLGYFFDNTTMILDLGYDVTDLRIEQSQQNLGANLKLGYTKANTNTDFGVDPIATELFFDTPANNIPGTMDYEESDVLIEQYAIEKIRAQVTSQPIGTTYDPANPSTDNQIVALYCYPTSTIGLPDTASPVYNFAPYDPSNNLIDVIAYTPVVFPDAQSSDPAAASATYVFGAYYPDTYINLPLSPCRALQRGGGQLLHSVLDEMDSDSLTFRNTGVMQYNNTVVGLSGIESNLVVGSGSGNVTTEFKDVQISSLPAQLFKPIILKFKSKYPVNMYQILNNNPNGYVRFFWNNENGFGSKEYKGFISKVFQSAATNAPTEFELWATPDMAI